MIRFRGPAELFDTASSFYDLVVYASTREGFVGVKKVAGGVEELNINDIDLAQRKFSLALLNSWLLAGGEILGYPIFIQMSEATYDTSVPEGLNFRVNDTGGVRTWRQWRGTLHEHRQLSDNTWIVPGNSWGEELPGTQAKIVAQTAGLTVLRKFEYQAILAAEPGGGA